MIRVVEFGNNRAAGYGGRLFALNHCEVVRVDRPDDASVTSTYAQAVDTFLHAGKDRVALDWASARGAHELRELAASADIVIADVLPKELDALEWWADEGESKAAQTRVSITPFGLNGPYRHWQGTSAVLLAMGGYTFLMGDPGRTPLTLPGHYPEYQAGQFAYLSALATHMALGRGVDTAAVLDVSILETVASLSQFTTVMWTYQERVRSRHGNHFENVDPLALYRCKDGWVAFNIVNHFWEPFTRMLGAPELIDDPRFATNFARVEHRQELNALIEAMLADKTRDDVLELGQREFRVPTGTMMNHDEVLSDPHLLEREFWTRDRQDGTVKMPRLAWSKLSGAANSSPSPTSNTTSSPNAGQNRRDAGATPLAGVRIVDFTHVWAGPLATRILADLGADVIKVEPPWSRGPRAPTPGAAWIYPSDDAGDAHWNRQGVFNKLNRNKRGLCVNLKQPGARELLLDLISNSDVVIDNFSARAMQSMGFEWETISALNPRLTRVSMPGFGFSGPYRDFVAYGPSVEPMTGLTAMMGYGTDEPRMSSIALPDAIAGVTAAASVVSALWSRESDGTGSFYEAALHESAIALFGDQFVYRQLRGEALEPNQNRHPQFAPHGVYRCAGDDAWIAIAITTDAQWTALANLVDEPWAQERRFADVLQRAEQHAYLDGQLEAWTGRFDKHALAAQLQDAGIAAGPVNAAPDLYADRQLLERRYFVSLGNMDVETVLYPGTPVLAGVANTHQHARWRPAPRLGEHNADVLGELLGLSDAEIAHLERRGVISSVPPD